MMDDHYTGEVTWTVAAELPDNVTHQFTCVSSGPSAALGWAEAILRGEHHFGDFRGIPKITIATSAKDRR